MKTFAFHSYKGGSGRTLALVNFALALRSIGRKVVMVDFDIDAPGLPYKLGQQERVRSGYVPYLVGTNCSDRAKGTNRKMRIEFIREVMIEIEKGLFLLPAGDPGRIEYWTHLDSPRFQELFSATPSPNGTGAGASAEEVTAAFRNDLLDIEEAANSPDYCLVDCKAARASVAVPLLLWADHIVEFFHCNQEGVFGLLMLEKMLDSADLGKKRPQVTPVVTRVPYGTTREQLQDEISTFMKKVPEGPVVGRSRRVPRNLQVLTEQRDIEVGDVVVLKMRDGGRHHIAYNYVELFASLTNLVTPTEKAASRRALKLNQEDEVVEQVFRFQHSIGELRNKDDQRNVALRKETLVELINVLVEEQDRGLASKKVPKPLRTKEISSAFELAGVRAGESFGREAMTTPAVWENNLIPTSVVERLRQWCKFDRSAGFGDWTSGYKASEKSGWVTFKGHFLEGTRDEIGASFVKGYIMGVLRFLVSRSMKPIEIDITSATSTKIEFGHKG